MTEAPIFRSPELMQPENSVLVVIDVQAKLLPLVQSHEQVERNVGRLLDAAAILSVPTLVTEQYPRGLGHTAEGLASKLRKDSSPLAKTSFSCCGSDEFRNSLREMKPASVLLCGIESHVCVLQTAMDLLAEGYRVFLAVDAISARQVVDHETALRRLESQGATLSTTETALFEWCQTASSEHFKPIQKLILEK